ncbi:DUF6377 domain-containing protein [Persicobacter diffluens]|uniref:DUF6377 domain-containing protein n=1 Tax=Persicobacter diffluens TaxID=981 RepID=A0AAN4VU94_9BACT|nr:hypothetical protein PEDI_06480 [Persicobacter diffluens]
MPQFLLIALLAGFPFFSRAENTDNPALIQLDETLQHRAEFTQKRNRKISSLRSLLLDKNLGGEERFRLQQKLWEEYSTFRIDSALYYCLQNESLGSQLPNDRYLKDAALNLSHAYILAGMTHEALLLLDQLEKQALNEGQKTAYYSSRLTLYNYLRAYLSKSPQLANYQQLYHQYQDSLLSQLKPTDVIYPVIIAENMMADGQTAATIPILQKALSSLQPTDRPFAFTAYTLATAYGLLGEEDKQIQALALSARSDIENGIKEHAALRELAILLEKKGESESAFYYTKIALEDATFSGSKLRTFEIGQILPLINQSYINLRDRKKRLYLWSLWLGGGLLLFILIAFLFFLRQRKKLQTAYQENQEINLRLKSSVQGLAESNQLIQTKNEQLAAANKQRETYIAQYLKLCSSYIGKMDHFRNRLRNKASSSSMDDLLKVLKSKEWIEEELLAFYRDFDQAFLDLYPNFVRDFNALLKPDAQVHLKEGELLNTELRIFALIRLGINESPQIAEFLRYSTTTIYNYRTSARNKAAGPRDLFENQVKMITS